MSSVLPTTTDKPQKRIKKESESNSRKDPRSERSIFFTKPPPVIIYGEISSEGKSSSISLQSSGKCRMLGEIRCAIKILSRKNTDFYSFVNH